MKSVLFIVVLSLLAVGYARDQEAELAIRGIKVIVLRRGPKVSSTVKF